MVEIKTTDIQPDEVDYPFIAEFTYNAKKSKFEQMQFTIEKYQESLQKHFQETVFSYIFTCVDTNLAGWLLLYKMNDEILLINPADSLEGVPVIDSIADYFETVTTSLLVKAMDVVKNSHFKFIETFLPISETTKPFEPIFKKVGFFLKLTYNDMKCDLSQVATPPGSSEYSIKIVEEISKIDLQSCYTDSFSNGDSSLYKYQSESERNEFYNDLYQEQYADNELSVGIFKENKLIGFVYVLEFEPGIKHISCMCVLPNHRGKGVGTFLVEYIIRKSKESGAKKITLGTEPQMVAYSLYEKHGFVDVATHNVYRWSKEDS